MVAVTLTITGPRKVELIQGGIKATTYSEEILKTTGIIAGFWSSN
jgi:hypothetical protein